MGIITLIDERAESRQAAAVLAHASRPDVPSFPLPTRLRGRAAPQKMICLQHQLSP